MNLLRIASGGLTPVIIWLSAGCASAGRDWVAARQADEIAAYERFLNRHPEAEQVTEARNRLELLRRDLPTWERTKREGTAEAYEEFAAEHRESPYAERAGVIAAEWRQDQSGRSVVDALEQGKVEVEASGSGGSLVCLRMRKTIDRPLRITVPVGMIFDCCGSAQDMTVLAEGEVDLDDREWSELLVLAACVDLMKPIPQRGDRFRLDRSARQKDLRKLLDALRVDAPKVRIVSADATTGQYQYVGPAPADLQKTADVLQAAIWIAGDNANYNQLGILTRPQSGGGLTLVSIVPPRVIDETDAALAMRMVDEAGIDITKKAIWRDRHFIARGVSDLALREWIERR